MDEDIQTSSIDFLRIWKDFDTDANGALDKVETSELVLKMIENIVTRYEECCGLKHRKFRLDVTLLNSFVNEYVSRDVQRRRGSESKEGDVRNHNGRYKFFSKIQFAVND